MQELTLQRREFISYSDWPTGLAFTCLRLPINDKRALRPLRRRRIARLGCATNACRVSCAPLQNIRCICAVCVFLFNNRNGCFGLSSSSSRPYNQDTQGSNSGCNYSAGCLKNTASALKLLDSFRTKTWTSACIVSMTFLLGCRVQNLGVLGAHSDSRKYAIFFACKIL